ncbi:hypothetical protein GCM10009678_74080 [Actinomadura kijaniata]|uniref:TnpA family transposase n=1 Tax=Actinomadura namibiensis TaxID=182080 RepID=A0A7W3LS02_ACTNM|nr:TnpA family transposase [Actinomadura namibiensis]
MIEGLLRHGTDAEIDASYTDTHGATVGGFVGFAFTELLGFKLLPRLKNLGGIQLYAPPPTRLADRSWPTSSSSGSRARRLRPFDITLPNTTMTRTAYTALLVQINAALRDSR